MYTESTKLILKPVDEAEEKKEVIAKLGDHVKEELYKFDCIQVTPETDASHFLDDGGDLKVPLVAGSDCHSPAGFEERAAERITYVKMARPDYQSLVVALTFSDTRVRFYNNLPESVPPRLLGLRLHGTTRGDNTFFEDTVLAFSDNLTCLIGPRGSGKSACIDALRYLMGYNRSLDHIPKVEDQIIDRQKHTLLNTRIEALYQTSDGRIHRIAATYDPKESYTTKVFDGDNNQLNIEDIETSGEYPIRLYGWSELELLAENPDTQRELLDRFIAELAALKEEKEGLFEKISDNTTKCLLAVHGLDEYFEDPDLDFRRLEEFKREFDALNTDDAQKVFADLDTIQKKRHILRQARNNLANASRTKAQLILLEMSKLIEEGALKEWATTLVARLKAKEFDDWVRETIAEHGKRIDLALQVIEEEDGALQEKENTARKAIEKAIGEGESITGDLRNTAKARYEHAKEKFTAYKKNLDELKVVLAERKRLLDAVEDVDKRIFATRHKEMRAIADKVQLVEDSYFNIELKLNQQGDRQLFRNKLSDGKITFSGNWRSKKRAEAIAANMTPVDFAEAIFTGQHEKLVGKFTDEDGTLYEIDKKYAQKIVEDNIPTSTMEGLNVVRWDSERAEALLKIQEIPVDDDFYIELGGKPIQHCSPGQRCSAMLPIVTLTSQAPLIIDQPEDNLDNRLVSRALFKILAKLKETRQIILATHSPNILVSGDAEQVLALNSNGDLEEAGCIDKPAIVQYVISLMEGGSEAFERREKKYKPYLG